MRGKPKLTKRPDSPYWFIYIPYAAGRREQRFSTGEVDYSEAERIFAQYLLERKKPQLAPLDEISVVDLLERYADYKKDDTTVAYHMKHLKPYFDGVFMSQVCNQIIREYAIHRTSQKVRRGKENGDKTVSAATVRRELDTLSACFGFAYKEGLIKEIPHIEKPRASPPRERWLTIEEFAKLWAACEREYLKVYIAIAMATTARPSSILELKWSQIDLDARLIHFNPPGRHQTHKYRPSVYINDSLLPMLIKSRADAAGEHTITPERKNQAMLIKLRDDIGDQYVIARKNGKRVASIKKSFKEACRRAGVVGATPYTLRHSAITWTINGGKTLAQAGQLAGHKEPRTTSRYAKYDPSFTKETVDVLATGVKLAEKLSENIKNSKKTPEKKLKKQCT